MIRKYVTFEQNKVSTNITNEHCQKNNIGMDDTNKKLTNSVSKPTCTKMCQYSSSKVIITAKDTSNTTGNYNTLNSIVSPPHVTQVSNQITTSVPKEPDCHTHTYPPSKTIFDQRYA